MYLRHTTRRKDGKVHKYWRLVRSVRVGRKVVQQTVAQLGELDAEGRARAKALARASPARASSRISSPSILPTTPFPSGSKAFGWSGPAFGDVWLGWRLWRALKLDDVAPAAARGARSGAVGDDGRGAGAGAAVRAVERIAHRGDLVPATALEDLLGLSPGRVNDDRLYRALDRLLPHKEALEQHLVAAWASSSRSTTTCCSTT